MFKRVKLGIMVWVWIEVKEVRLICRLMGWRLEVEVWLGVNLNGLF